MILIQWFKITTRWRLRLKPFCFNFAMNLLNGGTLFVQAAQWFNPEDLPPSYPPPGFSSNNPNPHFESPAWIRKKNDKNLKIFQKKNREKKVRRFWRKNLKFSRKGYFLEKMVRSIWFRFGWIFSGSSKNRQTLNCH